MEGGWQEYQFDNEALDENCLLLNMDVDKLVTSLPSEYCLCNLMHFSIIFFLYVWRGTCTGNFVFYVYVGSE